MVYDYWENIHTLKKHRLNSRYMKHILTLLAVLVLSASMPVQAQSNLRKANKQFELSAYNLAIKSYRKVLEKDNENVEALSKMADCYRHLNQFEEASKWYRLAIQQSGVDPICLFQYANVLKAKGEYDKAKEWFLIFGEGQPVYGTHFAGSCDFAMSMKDVPPLFKVKNELINSPESDFGPAFYDNKLVFSSARTDMVRSTEKAKSSWERGAHNQLFLSNTDANGFLVKPSFLQSELTNNFDEGPVTYSADGKVMAFTKNNFVNGTRQIPSSGMELSIYIAEVTSNGEWANAKAFPYNGSGYSSGYPYLSADGRTLYFSSNRPDGFGGYDIYVSYKRGDSWSTPENLGPVINSQGNEITPFVVDNNLYFSSDWHHGLGGFDIFRAVQEEGIWKKVFHLGNGPNSNRDDYGFIFDPKTGTGYFTSNRLGGKGKEDLYQAVKSTEQIVITVLDGKDRSPMKGAILDFTACGEPVFKTDVKGQYSFQALQGLACDVIVSKEGYKSFAFNLSSISNDQAFDIVLTAGTSEVPIDDYMGKVINATDNSSVANVRVKATEQASGLIIETTSDSNGDYHLPLAPEKEYVILFSKAGFMDTHNRVMTRDGRDRSVLGILPLAPSGTSLDNGVLVTTSPEPPKQDVPTTTTDPTDGATASIGDGETGDGMTTTLPKATEEEFEVQEGFSVQVAAVVVDQKVNAGKYLKLEEYGNVYSRAEKGFKKVRIGIFSSRSDAEAARKDIAKKGYAKAFIVSEKVTSLENMEFYSDVPNREETAPSTPVVQEETPTPVVDSGYKVRLASYKNLNFFDREMVEKIGTIEERTKGVFTIVLLSGFADLEAAQLAKKHAIDSGFKGAHIVVEENGKLKKVGI